MYAIGSKIIEIVGGVF